MYNTKDSLNTRSDTTGETLLNRLIIDAPVNSMEIFQTKLRLLSLFGANPNLQTSSKVEGGYCNTPLHTSIANECFITTKLFLEIFAGKKISLSEVKQDLTAILSSGGYGGLIPERLCDEETGGDFRKLYIDIQYEKDTSKAKYNFSGFITSIDFTKTDSEGKTTLLLAAKMRWYRMAELLLEYDDAKQAVNIPDKDLRTPMHYACIHGDAKLIKLLLQYGANIDAVDKYGKTPDYYLEKNNVTAQDLKNILDSVSINWQRSPWARKKSIYSNHEGKGSIKAWPDKIKHKKINFLQAIQQLREKAFALKELLCQKLYQRSMP
jgi:ankyrin repeat protein